MDRARQGPPCGRESRAGSRSGSQSTPRATRLRPGLRRPARSEASRPSLRPVRAVPFGHPAKDVGLTPRQDRRPLTSGPTCRVAVGATTFPTERPEVVSVQPGQLRGLGSCLPRVVRPFQSRDAHGSSACHRFDLPRVRRRVEAEGWTRLSRRPVSCTKCELRVTECSPERRKGRVPWSRGPLDILRRFPRDLGVRGPSGPRQPFVVPFTS